jgi:hypothetical protein
MAYEDKSFKLVDASAMTMEQIEDECNAEAALSFLLKETIVFGGKLYLVFVKASLMR